MIFGLTTAFLCKNFQKVGSSNWICLHFGVQQNQIKTYTYVTRIVDFESPKDSKYSPKQKDLWVTWTAMEALPSSAKNKNLS